MNKKLTENEIDEIVISKIDDENAWEEIKQIQKRAERGSREKFLQALSKVPKVEPSEEDKIK
ncbi:MAG: hypothetical protein ACR2J3_04050 [Aridibacter sp.]